MLLQVANHCMFTFVAVQAGVIWIHQIFIHIFDCCWMFGWFPVFSVWIIWKGSSDHQICEISCGFLFFLKNICLYEAWKKNIFLFESRNGILLKDQDLDRGAAQGCFSDLAKRLSAAQVSRGDGNIPSQGCMDQFLNFTHPFASDFCGSSSEKPWP